MEGQAQHIPVMLEECMDALQIQSDGIYVDGTFGRGGHSGALLQALGPNGQLHAYDRDPQAQEVAHELNDARLHFYPHSFAHLKEDMQRLGLIGLVNGILLDLGVSSPQLDTAERGFSFLKDGPLDMRMDPRSGVSAADWLAMVEESELSDVICRYGQERHHRRIAHAIVQRRLEQPLVRTKELADLVAKVVPKSFKEKKHPATRTFQAIRIHINEELRALNAVLEGSLDVLAPGGRMAVLCFHSLEVRHFKRWVKRHGPGHETYSRLSFAQTPKVPRLKRVGRARSASSVEVRINARSRSAQLRVIEKEVAS